MKGTLSDLWDHKWSLIGEGVDFESYIKVMPEMRSTGLFTDIGVMLYPCESPINEELWIRLQKLIELYDVLWDLDEEQFEEKGDYWQRLDNEGICIAKEVAKALCNSIPVYYFSQATGHLVFVE